jgi:hypothetical protein
MPISGAAIPRFSPPGDVTGVTDGSLTAWVVKP